ncbi:MarR family winged helix-turn-helix transcriptional regulator [Salinicoccus hispanicus]|uniref:MarR family transcriptional regulator n=1 Tax=Salinicoccus hispanicus TaxID=157225 RepID=A0A6N8U6S8_9STAP|nr:MarR family transcriptional regulator [Salinicoccus hispanicus]MXQ52041.1 MarR family transcriptional regulator [Salinicoccus hispanicus]
MKDILRDIGIISRALDSISNIEFKELDLAKGQFVYLVRICENPGIIQEKLAEILKIDRTTTARAIKNLEKNGLITKKTDSNNQKNKLLFPTERGEAIYPFIIRENEHSNAVALQGLTEDEIDVLIGLLERVKDNVSHDWLRVKKDIKESIKKGNK